MPLETKLNQKEAIKKALYFKGAFTTELLLRLHEQGVQIGAKSLTNRLYDLEHEKKPEVVCRKIEGHKELYHEIWTGLLI